MKYTQIPTDTFSQIQLNAGILCKGFNPSTGVVSDLVGATTGGIQFQDNVTYNDFGDDIDNCPKNTKELKKIDSHEVTMSGTFVTVNINTAKDLVGAGDISGNKITPRNDLTSSDFGELWWVGDYSDVNTGNSAGFIAIHLLNSLNTGGFQIQSTDKGKGQFAFTFMGHYSIDSQDTVPYEVYVKTGGAGSVTLNKHEATVAVGSTVKLKAVTDPEGQTVTWASDNTTEATVSNGTVTGAAAGIVRITASMTYDNVTYSDTCVVTVVSA